MKDTGREQEAGKFVFLGGRQHELLIDFMFQNAFSLRVVHVH